MRLSLEIGVQLIDIHERLATGFVTIFALERGIKILDHNTVPAKHCVGHTRYGGNAEDIANDKSNLKVG